jgi:hypothetical protein
MASPSDSTGVCVVGVDAAVVLACATPSGPGAYATLLG